MKRFACLFLLLASFVLAATVINAQEAKVRQLSPEQISGQVKELKLLIGDSWQQRILMQVQQNGFVDALESVRDRQKSIVSLIDDLTPHLETIDPVEIFGETLAAPAIKAIHKNLNVERQSNAEKISTIDAMIQAYSLSMDLKKDEEEASRDKLGHLRPADEDVLASVEARRKQFALDVAAQDRLEFSVDFEPAIESSVDEMEGPQTHQSEGEWTSLFNGENLEGWTPKICGFELGENFGNTFRVEDGLLKVGYDAYEDGFQGRFGHLFYKEKLSHYVLRVEYRFVGEQIAGGPGWALRNSGVMLHCQDPASIGLDQKFPVSIEMQMLGGNGKDPRTNANVCTPGTHMEMGGKLIKAHCRNSTSQTYHGPQWVTVEIEVLGDEVIRHKIDGKVVLEYQKPQLDPNDGDAKELVIDGNVQLKDGYISLQSESHPVEFRKVEIRKLDK